MTEIATAAIKASILNGEYPPGTHLVPARLEKELNLGRVAIREALKVLDGSGLVKSVPNKGAIVSKALDLEEMKEVYDIRLDLEVKACELAVAKISDEEIEKLEKINQEMACNPLDSNEYFELNRRFHMTLYRASGRHFLCQLISQIHDRIAMFRMVYPFNEKVIGIYRDQHAEIIETIKNRDTALAKKLMSTHLREGYNHMMEQNRQQMLSRGEQP